MDFRWLYNSSKLSFFFQTKDGRIAELETENAMLYLKLAQLRSTLQSSREEMSTLQGLQDSETKFRQNVFDSALRFKQELDVCCITHYQTIL